MIKNRLKLTLYVLLNIFPVLLFNVLFPIETDEIVIYRDRRVQLKEKFNSESIKINNSDLESSGLTSATLLNAFPEVNIKGQSLFIRGSDSKHQLVLLDGVIVNDPSTPNGMFDFTTLNLNSIESIEIVKGPEALMYGPSAIGGVVLIKTRSNTATIFPHKTSLLWGGEKTYSIGQRSIFKTNQISHQINVDHYQRTHPSFNPWSNNSTSPEKDKMDKKSLAYFFDSPLNNQLTLSGNFNFYQDVKSLDRGGLLGEDDPNYKLSNQRLSSSLSLKHQFSSQDEFAYDLSYLNYHRKSDDQLDPGQLYLLSGTYLGEQTLVEIKHHRKNLFIGDQRLQHFMNLQLKFENARINNDRYKTFEGTFHLMEIAPLNKTDQPLYLQLGFQVQKRKDFHPLAFYQTALSQNFAQSILQKVYFQHSSSGKTPTLFELYDPLYGNPNLSSEKTLHQEVGVIFKYKNTESHNAIYFDYTKDRIGFLGNRSLNFKRTYSKGFETKIKTSIFDQTWSAGLNLMQNKDLSSGKILEGRPQFKFTQQVEFYIFNGTWTLYHQYLSSRKDTDNTGHEHQLSPYHKLNLSVHFQLQDNISLRFTMENILRSKAEEMYLIEDPKQYATVMLNYFY